MKKAAVVAWSPLRETDCGAALLKKVRHRAGPQLPNNLLHLTVKTSGITVIFCFQNRFPKYQANTDEKSQ